MNEEMSQVVTDDAGVNLPRIYEIGYHITPAAKEEDLEKIVGEIRTVIEKAGGSFIAEGAPALTKLAYPIAILEGGMAGQGKRVEYDRGYFGWIKFEADVKIAEILQQSLKGNRNLLRFIIFQTVREDTRAKMKAPTLREVKRTDTIKAAPRRAEESSAPISEADLEKAIKDITQE